MAAKNILSQLNIVQVAALTDSGTGFIGFGAKADGLYMKNGAAAELRLLTAGDIGVNVASYGHSHSGYQASLSGTGFVKISGTTISYDPTAYLSTKANVEAVLTGSISSHFHDLSAYSTTGHTHSTSNLTDWGTATASFLTGITKAQVEAVLVGTISSHSHSFMGHNLNAHSDVWISSASNNQVFYYNGTYWVNGAVPSHTHTGVYAPVFSLTTTGTSGAATYSGNVLNIPQYSGYTLPLADSTTRGGIKIGTSGAPAAGIIDVGLYNDTAFIALTAAKIGEVLTGNVTSHSHSIPSHNIQSHSDVYIPVTLDGTYSGKALYWTGTNWGIGTPWAGMGYLTSITKAQVEAVLTGAITTHTHALTSHALTSHSDVNFTYIPSTGDLLRYSGTAWYQASLSTCGIQATLVSGTNIKTINNSSILGSGNLVVSAVWGGITGTLSSQTDLNTALGAKALLAGSSSQAFSTANLSVTGTISASSTITGSEVYRGSSRSLKKNIADFDFDAIGFLNDVSIKRYYLKSNNLFGIGFIAEDTHPWLSGDDQKSHVFGNHLGLLTKAIQEEDQKVESLKLEVLELQARVKELEIARANGWR